MLSLRSILVWVRDPSLPRDPSLRSGWQFNPSCWACEASWCEWEILYFVQDDDDSFRMTVLSLGWEFKPSCWACEASWYDWKILHFVQDDIYTKLVNYIFTWSLSAYQIFDIQKNAKSQNWTDDTTLFRRLLYQLSYLGTYRERGTRTRDLSLPKRAL